VVGMGTEATADAGGDRLNKYKLCYLAHERLGIPNRLDCYKSQ